MKPFLCLFASTLCIFVLVLRIEKLESQNQLIQTESDILRDQVDDMAFQNAQLLSRRTYEEGLKDGIENSQVSDYTRGYHAAINQAASTVTLSPEQSVTSN